MVVSSAVVDFQYVDFAVDPCSVMRMMFESKMIDTASCSIF